MNSANVIAEHFGYTDDWLRLGVVTHADLQQQFAEFNSSDDKCTEHYRCRAFLAYLRRLDSISDELLDALLTLSDRGPDRCDLTLNRAFDLVESDLLTSSQLRSLRERPDFSRQQSFTLAIDRQLLDRGLAEHGLTDDTFRDICELNDATMLQRLLNRHDISRDHVAWVAEQGCNKRLRNVATQMLRSRRFRNGG